MNQPSLLDKVSRPNRRSGNCERSELKVRRSNEKVYLQIIQPELFDITSIQKTNA